MLAMWPLSTASMKTLFAQGGQHTHFDVMSHLEPGFELTIGQRGLPQAALTHKVKRCHERTLWHLSYALHPCRLPTQRRLRPASLAAAAPEACPGHHPRLHRKLWPLGGVCTWLCPGARFGAGPGAAAESTAAGGAPDAFPACTAGGDQAR